MSVMNWIAGLATANGAVVHACKIPCHQDAVGYRGNLSPAHPHYLVLESGKDLYLNMIDPPSPLFMPSLFTSPLAFMKKHSADRKNILIHCNMGESRSPSLALLYLAKMEKAIHNDSYEAAREDFNRMFEGYNPGKGIQEYLSTHWKELDTPR